MQLSADRGVRRVDPLLAAALLLPGLAATPVEPVQADTPPSTSEVELRWSHYDDFQPGAERMYVSSPALYWRSPLGERDALAVSLIADSLSGASPLFHDTLSGASGLGIRDFRRAGDVAWTHWFEHWQLDAGVAFSDEADYDSVALRAGLSWSSADRNHTLRFALGASNDAIDSVNGLAVDRFRRVREAEVGWTMVLSPVSLLALGLSTGDARGYHDDPYKPLDLRPHSRYPRTLTVRWNRHFRSIEGTLRLEGRYYSDNWEVDALSLDAQWEQPVAGAWTLIPHLRYHTQSAAFFYADPPFGTGFVLDQPYSGDTRLAAFGAWTAGLAVRRQFAAQWSAEWSFDFYRQDTRWRWLGTGSPGIPQLSARITEVALRRQW